MNNSEFVEVLDQLFEKERQAILDGMFDELRMIANKKNQMIAQVPALKFPQATISDLMVKAKRNQDLLAAVVRGVRMVSNRVNSVRQNNGILNTYDKTGNRVALNRAGRALEWRA